MRKFISVLFALVLVLTFSMVTAAPVAASPGTLNVRPFTLGTAGNNSAAWSTVQEGTGSSSVLLTYVDGDNAYVEFTPATGTTVDDLETIADGWSWWYYFPAATGYGPLLELRFTSGDGHIDITVNTAEATHTHDAGTTKEVVAASTCIYFGNDATDQTSFYNNTGSVTLAGVEASIDAQAAMIAGGETAAAWVLTRVRAEIGWDANARTCYIDDIEIAGVTYYGEIQDAIDTASTGDTISVAAGTYTSGTIHVHTVENLTIESVAGAATTFITGEAGTDKMFEIGGHNGNTADGFTLDGFTLNGVYNYGVYMYVRNFDIKNNVITGTKSDGIVVTNPTTGPPTQITSGAITGNTITGLGASILNNYRPGILLEANDAAGAQINGITITNNTVTGFGTTTVGVEAAGIRLASVTGCGVVSDITLTGNTVSGNYIGLHIYGACTGLTIYGNTMTANNQGVTVCNSGVLDVSSTFDLYNNTITNNTGYGVNIILAASETISGAKDIMYNTITGNGVGIRNMISGGTDPVAMYNWWGRATGPYHATTNPGVVGYRGDTVSADVTYAPWLYLPDAIANDTVAEIYATSTPAYANAVVLHTVGWNTWSVPIGLDGQYNTWAELYTLTSLPYSMAYYFNPTTQAFVSLATTSTYAITPGEAFYVKMTAANSIPYCYSTLFSIPSRALGDGWDFIGGGLSTRTEIASCSSIATVGSTAGYTHIVIPTASASVRPFTLSTGTNAAAWSTTQKSSGSESVLLNYVSGDNSYVEFTPPTGITVNDLTTIADGWSWWYYASAANGPLLELRFTSGSGHVDITVNTAEASPTTGAGTTEEVTHASTCIYFGNDATDGTSFYNNTGSVTLAGVLASINAQAAMTAGSESAAAWALTRVRAEIGWVGSARTCYIDDIEINNITYCKSWVYIAGATTAGNFVAGEGYWVFLPIDRTLGLFDLTPVGWVAVP